MPAGTDVVGTVMTAGTTVVGVARDVVRQRHEVAAQEHRDGFVEQS